MTRTVLVLNGPNLNLLGTREPEIYGSVTLEAIAALCQTRAEALGLACDFRQSNSEGELVTWVQKAPETASGLVINAAAYSHTSVALHDALNAVNLPSVEVHLSNIFTREEFRHHSFVADAVTGSICGFGATGYELAIEAISAMLQGETR
ncbi:MAG: type II 3-dehydroquinate dehydratase [Alphaproteobacteria bacterium]